MFVVVRAHNEESTVAGVVERLRLADVGEVWVAASGCVDGTVGVALEAGAEVIETPLGLGASTCAVLERFVSTPVVFVDGDLFNVNSNVVGVLGSAAGCGFVGKGAMVRAGRSSSRLPVMAEEFGVVLPDVPPQALTSAYSSYPAGFADCVDLSFVPEGRGSDLMLSLLAYDAGFETVVVPAGPREHRDRGEAHVAALVEGNKAALSVFARKFLLP